jgi:hypothetical protein
MENEFNQLKLRLKGAWTGEGFAKFPTIEDTGYTEEWTFKPDEDKSAIHYEQKTSYNNKTADNGKTVFWDTGFILLKADKILLVSAQSGGRLESYELKEFNGHRLIFECSVINNDDKTIRSQRIIHLTGNRLDYELNMSTKQADVFQNHLKASLTRVE